MMLQIGIIRLSVCRACAQSNPSCLFALTATFMLKWTLKAVHTHCWTSQRVAPAVVALECKLELRSADEVGGSRNGLRGPSGGHLLCRERQQRGVRRYRRPQS